MRLEQGSDITAPFADQPALSEAGEPQPALLDQNQADEQLNLQPTAYWLDGTGIPILRATRTWIQYGTVGFAVICILVGAIEGLLGR
jgi:hypothetical protein